MSALEKPSVEIYRLYIMDSFGRHIEDCIDIEAVSDEDAVQAVRLCRDCRPSELWLRNRVVRCFPRYDLAALH